jgi:hypothetical protein
MKVHLLSSHLRDYVRSSNDLHAIVILRAIDTTRMPCNFCTLAAFEM